MNAAVKELTETFVSNLSNLIRDVAMKTVREALGADAVSEGGAAAHLKRSARSGAHKATAHSRSRSKGQKRSPEDLEALTDKLLNYIATNPGERIEQIGKGMGVPTKDLALPVKKLVAGRSIRTTGQKRSTQYYARG